MEVLYVCLVLLFSTGISVPITNRRGLRRAAETFAGKGSYGIVGSHTADISDYPYTASVTLETKKLLLGGGAILNKYWILCSAFEIQDVAGQYLTVRVGSSNAAGDGQKLDVAFAILHEKFNVDSYQYDVALMKTAVPIKLNKDAKPIRIAKNKPMPGVNVQVTGFGNVTSNEAVHGRLQVATVDVKTDIRCNFAYPSCIETCLCADDDEVGPCSNDFGDPLVRNKELVGWFIGGDYCNLSGSVDLYSNAASLRNWILDKITQNSNEDEMEGIDDDDFYRAFDN